MQVLSVTWFGRVYEIAGGVIPEVSEASLKDGDILFAIGSVLYAVAAFVSALRASGDALSSEDTYLYGQIEQWRRGNGGMCLECETVWVELPN